MTRFELPPESNDGGHDHGSEQSRTDSAESDAFAVTDPSETTFSVSGETAVESAPPEGAFARYDEILRRVAHETRHDVGSSDLSGEPYKTDPAWYTKQPDARAQLDDIIARYDTAQESEPMLPDFPPDEFPELSATPRDPAYLTRIFDTVARVVPTMLEVNDDGTVTESIDWARMDARRGTHSTLRADAVALGEDQPPQGLPSTEESNVAPDEDGQDR